MGDNPDLFAAGVEAFQRLDHLVKVLPVQSTETFVDKQGINRNTGSRQIGKTHRQRQGYNKLFTSGGGIDRSFRRSLVMIHQN